MAAAGVCGVCSLYGVLDLGSGRDCDGELRGVQAPDQLHTEPESTSEHCDLDATGTHLI